VLVDRLGVERVLGPIMIVFGLGTFFTALGGFAFVVVGCALCGIGMAGWPLPLGLLRRETESAQIGWRTAVYRGGVDGALFLGPMLSGLMADAAPYLLPAMCATALIAIGGVLLIRRDDTKGHRI